MKEIIIDEIIINYLFYFILANIWNRNFFKEHVRAEIIRQRSKYIESLIWENEATAARDGALTRYSWSQTELNELISKGDVDCYSLLFNPGHSIAVLSNQKLWKFIKSRS